MIDAPAPSPPIPLLREGNAMHLVFPVKPQVADTNLFEHIDYLASYRWFDRARTELYMELFPGFHCKPHGLVLVNTQCTYLIPTFVDDPLEVRSWVSRIGGKSFTMVQQLWRVFPDREPELCVDSTCVLCAIDFTVHKGEPLNDHFRAVLQKYYDPGDAA